MWNSQLLWILQYQMKSYIKALSYCQNSSSHRITGASNCSIFLNLITVRITKQITYLSNHKGVEKVIMPWYLMLTTILFNLFWQIFVPLMCVMKRRIKIWNGSLVTLYFTNLSHFPKIFSKSDAWLINFYIEVSDMKRTLQGPPYILAR